MLPKPSSRRQDGVVARKIIRVARLLTELRVGEVLGELAHVLAVHPFKHGRGRGLLFQDDFTHYFIDVLIAQLHAYRKAPFELLDLIDGGEGGLAGSDKE